MSSWGQILDEVCSADLLGAFQRNGEALFVGDLNNSHSGNLSVRDGDDLWITCTRTMCHNLGARDIVKAPIDGSGDRTLLSREAIIHEGIYRATKHEAVVHCHPRDAIAVSFLVDVIRPLQIEGHGALPGEIPVLEVEIASASPSLAEKLGSMLDAFPAVMVRGHGLFVGGGSLDQATHRAFVVNDAAYFLMVALQNGADIEDLLTRPYISVDYGKTASAGR